MIKFILRRRSSICIIVLKALLLPVVGCGSASNDNIPVTPDVTPVKYHPSVIAIENDFTRHEAVDGGHIDRAPEITHYVKPYYPMTARTAGIEGTALLEVIIDTDGRVESAKIVESKIAPSMKEALLKAANRYVYRPGIRDQMPVRCKVTHLIRFTLNDDAIRINIH